MEENNIKKKRNNKNEYVKGGKKEIDISDNNNNSGSLNVNLIYSKIAPYLSKPDIIKKILNKYSKLPREQFIKKIENQIERSDQIKRTDLRILLNSI